jgi:hypothetical protein
MQVSTNPAHESPPDFRVPADAIFTRTNRYMKTFSYAQVTLVLSSLMLAAAVSAYPQSPESRAVILNQEKEVNFDGTFKNKYAPTFCLHTIV